MGDALAEKRGKFPSDILLVTSGDHARGLGHIFRCLALGDAIQEHYPAVRVCFDLTAGPETGSLVQARHFPLCSFSDWLPGLGERGGLVVVDRLASSIDRMAGFRSPNLLLVALDDTGPGRFVADLAVNALYPYSGPRPPKSATKELDGLAYLVLDARFASSPRKEIRSAVRNLLLVQGGADTFGVLPRLVTLLGSFDSGMEINVWIGPAFQHQGELAKALDRGGSRFKLHRNPSPDQVVDLMLKADVAITAAGITCCELACLGTPLLVYTEEQLEIELAQRLESEGAAKVYPVSRAGPDAGLLELLRRLCDNPDMRRELSRRAQELIDGKGADRVLSAVERLYAQRSYLAV